MDFWKCSSTPRKKPLEFRYLNVDLKFFYREPDVFALASLNVVMWWNYQMKHIPF